MTERATKKRGRERAAPAPPFADLRLDSLSAGEEKDGLERAVRCFEAGNFAEVQRLTETLGASKSEGVRAAAVALRGRVSVDKVQVAVVAACALLLLLVALRYLA